MKGRYRVKSLWLDIDGVIADFDKYFLNYFKLPDHPPTDWEDSRFVDNISKVTDEFWAGVPRIESSALFRYPIAGYCTARKCSDKVLKNWIADNGFQSAQIVNVGFGGSKGEKLKSLGCEVYVDDAYHNYIDVANQGIECYLMTRSHNKKYDVGKHRIDSLLDLEKILISI